MPVFTPSMNVAAITLVLATAMVFLAGCLGDNVPQRERGEEVSQVRDLDQGQQSGHRDEDRRVITSKEKWKTFWQAHDERLDEEDPPEVDFSKERVVAVLMGERANGCYAIKVTDVRLDADAGEMLVNVTSRVPGPDEMCTQAIVHPYHFVAVPDDGSEVAFLEHETDSG